MKHPRSSLTPAEIKCLIRTRIAADFGRREIMPREALAFAGWTLACDAVWDRMKARGFVANGRGITVRLTVKGERALHDLGL
jgi:hypothetical protein